MRKEDKDIREPNILIVNNDILHYSRGRNNSQNSVEKSPNELHKPQKEKKKKEKEDDNSSEPNVMNEKNDISHYFIKKYTKPIGGEKSTEITKYKTIIKTKTENRNIQIPSILNKNKEDENDNIDESKKGRLLKSPISLKKKQPKAKRRGCH